MYHKCASLCSLCKGKEGVKIIYISLGFKNCRVKTIMQVIRFLGLIAKLALFCEDGDVGNSKVTNYVFSKVGVGVLTRYRTQASFKLQLQYILHLWFHKFVQVNGRLMDNY
jgi:F0F1-type ATP synthase alpha subunit